VIAKPPEDLRALLLLILQTQMSCLEQLATVQADIYALTLTVGASDPKLEAVLQKAIAEARRKHAEAIQNQMQLLALMRTTVSTMPQ
jgi:DNA polymerase III delta prime subunit